MVTHSNSGVLAPHLVRLILPPINPQCTILGLPWVRKGIFMELPELPGSPISQTDHFWSWWPGGGSQAACGCALSGRYRLLRGKGLQNKTNFHGT